VRVCNNDSLEALYAVLDEFTPSDFILIDPYLIFEKHANGKTYFDLFVDCVRKGVKSMLWYGFDTGRHRDLIRGMMKDSLRSSGIEPGERGIAAIELYLSSIMENDVVINPGVVDCGVIIGNMSRKSADDFRALSNELVRIYSGSSIGGMHRGTLDKDESVL
jgi:23S rRNA (adenine2030-N6)-methyltransferase